MRNPAKVFHLAIPCADLNATEAFYSQLGCTVARRYEDRLTINFFGDQLVCHLAPEEVNREVKMYPRHFGITFRRMADYQRLLNLAQQRRLRFFRPPFVRFQGLPEQHSTFFLVDPANNLLEFKFYSDATMMH